VIKLVDSEDSLVGHPLMTNKSVPKLGVYENAPILNRKPSQVYSISIDDKSAPHDPAEVLLLQNRSDAFISPSDNNQGVVELSEEIAYATKPS